MSPQLNSFEDVIGKVRRRVKARVALRGLFITLAIAAGSLLVAALVAGKFSQRPVVLSLLRALPFVLTAASAWLFLIRPVLSKAGDSLIARLVEEKCGLQDRLITSVEYSKDLRSASPEVVARLVTDTNARCASITANEVVDPRRSYVYGAGAVLIAIGMAVALFLSPKPLSQGLAELYSSSDSVSASAMFISVNPGTARVPRGSDQHIKASLSGFEAELAQVFIRKQGAENWVAQTMEPAKHQGEFLHIIFNIQDSVTYYVEAKGVRSAEFALEVADLPFVKQIDLVLNFPAYTGLPNKKIENGGEVAALKGTLVQVLAHMTGSARSARIVLNDGTKAEMSTGDNLFTGQFEVKGNGTYKIEVTSDDGERYNGSNEYDITVLEDQPPTVLIDKPGRDMKVTSIQEVFTQVRAEDDYGVAAIELFYSVNGGEEQRVHLQELKRDAPRTLSGAHTFFLEEHALKPGDFISYYAKARDSNQESTSDIYFLEVRPFDRQFRQAQQQGSGEGDQDQNQLARRQREIIAATFRLQREQATYTPEEKEENFGAVTLSQEKLKNDADVLVARIRRRLGDQLAEEEDFAKLVEYLAHASKEMESAVVELRARKTKEALSPEQRALQQLLRAEAIFRDIQVARGGEGQGSGEQDQELADLFELQLDKMKNQYETLQREQRANQSKQQDELARRLAELARRAQQQLEQQSRAQQQQQGGGGGGGSQRQQQQMIDEAQKMARELERLSRDRRDPKLEEAARQLQQSADELRRAQAASSQSQSSQGGSQQNAEATARQLRALERMEQARRLLESSQRAGGQKDVQRLRQEAEQALKRQDEIAQGVDELARNKGAAGAEQKAQQLSERKQALADQVAGLERDIDQTARGMGADRQKASDKLREAAGSIRQNRIPDRIRQNNQMIASGWYEQAREREKIIRGNLEDVLKDLQAAEGNASRQSSGETLEDALNRARALADNLESLRRRMESEGGQQTSQQSPNQQQGQSAQQSDQSAGQRQTGQQSQSRGNRGQRRQQGQRQQGQRGQQSQQAQGQQQGQGQQPGQQPGQQTGQGQQQGQGQQPGQQQGEGQANQRGGLPNNAAVNDSSSMGGGPPRGGQRQLDSELRQRLAEAEELRRALGPNSDLARELARAIEQLRRINPDAFSDPNQLALLKNEVIDPLRQLEVELARRLQAKLGNNGPGALGEGDAPDRYRKMIEDYYRRLSMRAPEKP